MSKLWYSNRRSRRSNDNEMEKNGQTEKLLIIYQKPELWKEKEVPNCPIEISVNSINLSTTLWMTIICRTKSQELHFSTAPEQCLSTNHSNTASYTVN